MLLTFGGADLIPVNTLISLSILYHGAIINAILQFVSHIGKENTP